MNGPHCPSVLYRVEGSEDKLFLYEYYVVKETPKGWWISRVRSGSPMKWVGKNHHKQWACPSPRLALQSYICRKVRHVQILKKQLTFYEKCLALARNTDLGQLIKMKRFSDPYSGPTRQLEFPFDVK